MTPHSKMISAVVCVFVFVVVVVENVAYQDDQCCRLCTGAVHMLCQPVVLFLVSVSF